MAKKVVKKTVKKTVKRQAHESPKAIWVILTIVIVILIAAFVTSKHTIPASQEYMKPGVSLVTSFDFGNQTISLNDEELTFVNGTYKNPDPEGEHMANIANKSVSPDGTKAAAIIVDSTEGSGTFYYLVGAIKQDGHDVYATPVALGDRIKIVSVVVANPGKEDNGIVTVQYLDRAEDAPMSAEPTEKKTVEYAFEENGNLIEVLK